MCRLTGLLLVWPIVCILPISGSDCDRLLDVAPTTESTYEIGHHGVTDSGPVVETLVAEPTAIIERDDDGIRASAENAARSDFELAVPQNQVLMVALRGQAHWADQTSGRIGFYLCLQVRIEDAWTTIGLDGAGDARTGPSAAKGRPVVPVVFPTPGDHRLRAIIRTVVELSRSSADSKQETAEDLDQVMIDVAVLAAPNLAPQIANRPAIPEGDAWLPRDVPQIQDTLPQLPDAAPLPADR